MSITNYVEYKEYFGIPTKEVPCITGKGVPSTSTIGVVGLLYMDSDSGRIYKCIAVKNGLYIWSDIATSNDIICSTSGEIITMTDASDKPLTGLKIFGKTVIDDSGSMVSVGDSGSLITTVCGKNLFIFPYIAASTNSKGFTATVDEKTGKITLNGKRTASGAETFRFRCSTHGVGLIVPGWYTISMNNDQIVGDNTATGSVRIWCNYRSSSNYTDPCNAASINAKQTVYISSVVSQLVIRVGENIDELNNFVMYPQLEVGKTATEFERYTSQTITTQTPNGLHGILVTSGGNYIDAEGHHWICDVADYGNRKRIQSIGVIESYTGEEINGVYMSSTGALTTGAKVIYALENPIVTDMTDEEYASYAALHTNYPNTTIYGEAGVEVEYVTDTKAYIQSIKNDIEAKHTTYVKPVEKAWEQRMLERIDQTLIPMTALRKIAKAPSGYTEAGSILSGINYSSVGKENRLLGAQVPLSTYYSAMENPASKMYTEDIYQEESAKSTFYGITCSSFVSYVCGFPEWIWTSNMAELWADKVIPINNENDLFQIRRGDILVNRIVVMGTAGHTRLVRDVVYCRITGKLLGFNIAESAKPYCKVTFYDFAKFLDQFSGDQPYSLVRLDDSEYGLDIVPIAYSKSIYPDYGDGGKYALGESVWLYIPNKNAKAIIYSVEGGEAVTVALQDMAGSFVNDVLVYKLTLDSVGTYTICTDMTPNDPCKVFIV